MRTWVFVSTMLATGLLLLPDMVRAQQAPSPNVTVQERPRPRYDPLGIRAGGYLIFPSVRVEGNYDSNVFATPNDEDDDFGLIISPRVNARSQFPRHRLDFTAFAEIGRYEEFSRNNYEDFGVGAVGVLDVTRRQNLRLRLSAERDHETRAEPDAVGRGNDVTKFWNLLADAAYRVNFNRVFVEPRAGVRRLDYEDTGNINQDDRDRNVYQAGLRAGYAVSPRFSVFGQGMYNIRRYDETPNDAGEDRDSEGYTISIGTEIDITGILFGELQVGYSKQEYDDDALDDVDGFGGTGRLTWNVTPLTTVIGEVVGELRETTVSFGGDQARADRHAEIGIDVTHELRRNILLNANARYLRDDFVGTDRVDDIFRVGAGVTYLLNRNFSIDARYRFDTRKSDDNDAEFDRQQVFIGFVAKL